MKRFVLQTQTRGCSVYVIIRKKFIFIECKKKNNDVVFRNPFLEKITCSLNCYKTNEKIIKDYQQLKIISAILLYESS